MFSSEVGTGSREENTSNKNYGLTNHQTLQDEKKRSG